MLLDGSLCDPQSPGDPRVRAALGHQRKHVALALTEAIQWVSAPTNRRQASCTSAGSTTEPPLQCVPGCRRIRYVGDAALEQIADPLTARQKLHGVFHGVG